MLNAKENDVSTEGLRFTADGVHRNVLTFDSTQDLFIFADRCLSSGRNPQTQRAFAESAKISRQAVHERVWKTGSLFAFRLRGHERIFFVVEP